MQIQLGSIGVLTSFSEIIHPRKLSAPISALSNLLGGYCLIQLDYMRSISADLSGSRQTAYLKLTTLILIGCITIPLISSMGENSKVASQMKTNFFARHSSISNQVDISNSTDATRSLCQKTTRTERQRTFFFGSRRFARLQISLEKL